MNKEKWISEILQTAKEIKPAAANPYMATRVEAKLQETFPVNKLPLRWVYISSVFMLALLVLNITIWRGPAPSSATSGMQQLIQEYGLDNTDLYSMNLLNRQHE